MLPESFEHVLKAAQLAGSLTPAWKKFIRTKFFVAILRSPDDDPKNFLLSVSRNPGDGKPVVIIAEVRDRIDQHHGDGVVAVTGADIVRRLGDQGGILIELSDGQLRVSRKRVAWLRSGIEVTQARVATRKVLQAAAPAAPLPVLSVRASQPAGSAPPAPVRRSLEALAALHLPKPPKTGLEFFAPSQWSGQKAPAPGVGAGEPGAGQRARPLVLVLLALGVAAAVAFLLMDQFGAVDAEPAPVAQPAPANAQRPAGPAPEAPSAVAALLPAIAFTPADNSFTVSVPGLPEELELTPDQVELMGELRMHQYKLVTGERIYTMQATDYAERMPPNLAAALNDMQASIVGSDGTLVSAAPVTLRGALGREVRVSLANGAVRAARFVFVGSKFCMVAVVAADGRTSGPEINAFLHSFQLN